MLLKDAPLRLRAVVSVCFICLIAVNLVKADSHFPNFTFGCSAEEFQRCSPSSQIIAGPWVLDSWQSHHDRWMNNFHLTANQNKIPYVHIYLAAGLARKDWGLQDCNMASQNTLCQRGAEYIRANSSKIANSYSQLASSLKAASRGKQLMIHIEPDFYQYHSDPAQNKPLTQNEAWTYMNSWTDSIKKVLPNAILVMDISPWNRDLQGWSSGFTNFEYAGLVGKIFPADGDGSVPNGIDGKTYRQMSQMTGKKLIVNTAHGPGGYPTPFQYSWTNRGTLEDRWDDGVVAILQSENDASAYSRFIGEFSSDPIPSGSSGGIGTNPPPQTPPDTNPNPSDEPPSTGSGGSSNNNQPQPPSNPPSPGINNPPSNNNSPSSSQLQIETLIDSDWSTGFCTKIRITNSGSSKVNNWSVSFKLDDSFITNNWNGNFSGNSGTISVTPLDWGKTIEPNQMREIGFCAQKTGANYKATNISASGN